MKRIFILGLVLLVGACTQSKSYNGTVDGIYRVDGKDTKISFARSFKGEVWNSHPTIEVALTEKDSSAAKNDPLFWRDTYGAAVVITLAKSADGYDVIGSNFLHAALKNGGANGSGIVDLKDTKEANGQIASKLFTKPNTDIFGQKLEVDLNFKVPLPE